MSQNNLFYASLVVSSLLAVGCVIMPPPQSGGGSGPAQGSTMTTPTTPEAPTSTATGATPTAPETKKVPETKTPETKTPVPTTIEVRNRCPKTVQLFIGDRPKFGSGTKTSISSNTTTSFPRKADGTASIWIIDDQENGITAATPGPDAKYVEIQGSCKEFAVR